MGYSDSIGSLATSYLDLKKNSPDSKSKDDAIPEEETEFAEFLSSKYGIDEKTAEKIYELYPENTNVDDLMSSFSDSWDQLLVDGQLPDDFEPLEALPSVSHSDNSANDKNGMSQSDGNDSTGEPGKPQKTDTSPADLDKVKQEWEDVTKDGEISVDEIMKHPDLKKFILNELNFDKHSQSFNSEKDGINEFLKFTADAYMANPDACSNMCLKLDKDTIDKITADYMNGENYKNRLQLKANDDGSLPESDNLDANWIQVDLGDGKSVTFEGETAALNYNKFVELYNNSDTMRKNMDEVLSSAQNHDFTFRTDRKNAEEHPEANGGHSSLDSDYVVIGRDTSYGLIAHEFSHNVTQLRGHESHGRNMDLDISNILDEAAKNDPDVKKSIEDAHEMPGLMGLLSQGEDHAVEKLGDTPEVHEAFKEYSEIVQAIKDNDPEKAKEAFEKIDKNKTIKIGGEEFKLGDLVSEELTAALDSDTRYGDEGLSAPENKYRMAKFIGMLAPEDQDYFNNAFTRLNQEPMTSDQTGINPKELWDKYGKQLDYFFRQFDIWKGDDKFLKKSKVEEIAENKDGEWSKQDQETAQFFLDHDEVWHSLDVGKDGDRTQKGDDAISTRDTLHFLDDSDRFGKDFIDKNRDVLDFIHERWDVWNGDNTIVTFDDLHKIAKQEGENSFHEPWTDQEAAAAQFILDNPTFGYFLDIYGSQKSDDGKIGNDFLTWYDERVKG